MRSSFLDKILEEAVAKLTPEECGAHLKTMKGALSVKYIREAVRNCRDDFDIVWKSLKSHALPVEFKSKEAEDLGLPNLVFGDESCPHPLSVADGDVKWWPNRLLYMKEPVSLRRLNFENKWRRRYDPMKQRCMDIIDALLSERFFWYISEPLPEDEINNPPPNQHNLKGCLHRLRRLKNNLRNELFVPLERFGEEVRDVFKEIFRLVDSDYTLPGIQSIARITEDMSRYFEREFAFVEGQLHSREEDICDMYSEDIGEEEFEDLEERLQKLDYQLKQGQAGEGRGKRKGAPKPKVELTERDKSYLLYRLERLPEVILDYIVDIIKRHNFDVERTDPEWRKDVHLCIYGVRGRHGTIKNCDLEFVGHDVLYTLKKLFAPDEDSSNENLSSDSDCNSEMGYSTPEDDSFISSRVSNRRRVHHKSELTFANDLAQYFGSRIPLNFKISSMKEPLALPFAEDCLRTFNHLHHYWLREIFSSNGFRKFEEKMIWKLHQRAKVEIQVQKLAEMKSKFWEDEEKCLKSEVEVLGGKRMRKDLEPWNELILNGRNEILKEMGMVARKKIKIERCPRKMEKQRKKIDVKQESRILGPEFFSPDFYFNQFKHPSLEKFKRKRKSVTTETRSLGQENEEERRGKTKLLKNN